MPRCAGYPTAGYPHRPAKGAGLHLQPLHRCAQPDARAHGVCQKVEGLGQVKIMRRLHHRGHIALIIGEVMHMARHRIIHQPISQPLTAPVDHQRGKAIRSQITCCAAVFFNIFRASGKQQNRALRATPVECPDPQAHAIVGTYPPGLSILWPIGQICTERGRFHEASTWPRFIAVPISPETPSLPLIKADAGSRSPSRID